MTREKVNALSEKFDKQIPSVCSFRFRNKLAKAPEEKYEEVLNTPLKKKGPAVALSVFGGWFGLHRFYLGDKKHGIITLILFGIIAALLSVTIALSAVFYTNLKTELQGYVGDYTLVSVTYEYDTQGNITNTIFNKRIGSVDDLGFKGLFTQVISPESNYRMVEESYLSYNKGKYELAANAEILDVKVVNDAAIVFDIYAAFTLLLFLGFFAWYIVDIIRTVEDVPFANYERLMIVATGTDKDLYKAESAIAEEAEESVEEVEEIQEEVAQETPVEETETSTQE